MLSLFLLCLLGNLLNLAISNGSLGCQHEMDGSTVLMKWTKKHIIHTEEKKSQGRNNK